jgi:acetoin utilization protein AcuB
MYIVDHMVRQPVRIKPETTVATAQKLLRSHNFRHLPVVDDQGHLLGMITDRDLRSAYPSSVLNETEQDMEMKRLANTPVKKIMGRRRFFLTPQCTLDDALLLLSREKIGALPVVDETMYVLGIFSIRDLIRAYTKLYGVGELGSIMLALQHDGAPKPLSRLTRVLEEHNIRFSRLIRPAATAKQRGEIIYLRVHTYNINAVLLILRKAGFKMYEPMVS